MLPEYVHSACSGPDSNTQPDHKLYWRIISTAGAESAKERELNASCCVPVLPDVVLTSEQWLLGREHVSPGIFIAAVGSDSLAKLEIEPALLAQSSFSTRPLTWGICTTLSLPD